MLLRYRVYAPTAPCLSSYSIIHPLTVPIQSYTITLRPFFLSPTTPSVLTRTRVFPERGMEGSRHTVCFQASDQYQMNPLEEVCVVLHVQKCRYCARVGETLKYIAEHYNHDTNWLRLWNYNPGT